MSTFHAPPDAIRARHGSWSRPLARELVELCSDAYFYSSEEED